jgi:diaminopimelate decarboxylase
MRPETLATAAVDARGWWRRPDLDFSEGVLHLAGHNLERVGHEFGTPSYAYSVARVRANVERLRGALEATGVTHRVLYAMKANRSVPLLTYLRSTGLVGIDVCSPNELLLARRVGFAAKDISYTATSVSEADLDIVARHPDVRVNADSLSTIRRLALRCPGRRIGLRINPALGVGYGENGLLRYSGERVTKFGIYRDHLDEALALARSAGLVVDGIHFHTGCGYLGPQLEAWEAIVRECLGFLSHIDGPVEVNLGGGLGVPHAPTDRPLDLDAWAAIVQRNFGDRNVRVSVEPGDFIAKDAGLILTRVNTVETKRGVRFIGVDSGFNLAPEPVFYQLPIVPVAVSPRGGPDATFAPATLAGNINEALDVWAEGVQLPADLREGDLLALLNAGGYAQAMASDHCMRGGAPETLLW